MTDSIHGEALLREYSLTFGLFCLNNSHHTGGFQNFDISQLISLCETYSFVAIFDVVAVQI